MSIDTASVHFDCLCPVVAGCFWNLVPWSSISEVSIAQKNPRINSFLAKPFQWWEKGCHLFGGSIVLSSVFWILSLWIECKHKVDCDSKVKWKCNDSKVFCLVSVSTCSTRFLVLLCVSYFFRWGIQNCLYQDASTPRGHLINKVYKNRNWHYEKTCHLVSNCFLLFLVKNCGIQFLNFSFSIYDWNGWSIHRVQVYSNLSAFTSPSKQSISLLGRRSPLNSLLSPKKPHC